jgi:hypothetical protein
MSPIHRNTKSCASGAPPDARNDLNECILLTVEYILVLKDTPPPPAITFFADLITGVMKADPEQLEGKTVFYFTVGISIPLQNGTKYKLNRDDWAILSH